MAHQESRAGGMTSEHGRCLTFAARPHLVFLLFASTAHQEKGIGLKRARTYHFSLVESSRESLSPDSLSHLETRIIHASQGQSQFRLAGCRWSEVQQSAYHRTQYHPWSPV